MLKILQARLQQYVNWEDYDPSEVKWCEVKSLSHVQLFVIPWTVAYQAPLSMGFSRQEHCNGLPFPSPGDVPDPGIEPWSPALQVVSLTTEAPGKIFPLVKFHKNGIAECVMLDKVA